MVFDKKLKGKSINELRSMALEKFSRSDVEKMGRGSLLMSLTAGRVIFYKSKAEKKAEDTVSTFKTTMMKDFETSISQKIAELTKRDTENFKKEVMDMVTEEIKSVKPAQPIRIEVAVGKIKTVGLQHYLFPKLLQLAKNRIHAWLTGPAGSGKTYAGEAVANTLNLDFYCMSVSQQTTKTDLLGYMDANGKYVPSLLRKAYEKGGLFLLDEVDNGNANVLSTINAMSSSDIGAFPDKMIKKHKDFVLFASANTWGRGADRLYVGRQPIDAATMDRFACIDFDYDEKLEKALYPDPAWTEKVISLRHAAFDLKEKVVISPRASANGAKLLKIGWTEEEAANAVIWKGISIEIKNRIINHVSGGGSR